MRDQIYGADIFQNPIIHYCAVLSRDIYYIDMTILLFKKIKRSFFF